MCGAALEVVCSSCGAACEPHESFCGECGKPLTIATASAVASAHRPSPSPALPASFAGGRYQVQRFLGEGGRKRVYLARDTRLDRDVAFAVIKTDGLDEAGLARVRREAQAMGRLGDHPHIVTIHDIGDDGGQPFIVSQYMAGGALDDLLLDEQDHRLPLGRALTLARQICYGLAHAHGQGVIHRDIKPGNIWLTSDGTAKLGDFGLAVALDRSRLTMAGTMVGTAAYMPPEQALGGQTDARSDLYSLGCVLYEMLAGRPPFLADDTVAVISQHINTPPLTVTWHNPAVPVQLDDLILSLLAKAPEDRPASAAEVTAAVASIDASIANAATAPPAPPSAAAAQVRGIRRGPLVGREKEMAQLKDRLEDSLSGRGSLVMLVGEPGIGKTRLADELSVYARLRGAQALSGQCYEGDGAPPYIPFVEALRQYVASRPAEELRSELGDAASDVAKLVSDVRTTLPDIPPSPEQEPEAERYRLLEAVTAFLVNASTANPLLVVLDDLHWADKPSLVLLEHLARRLDGARILVVGTYRDVELDRRHPLAETIAGLRRERLYERILLRGLDAEGVRAMLAGRGSMTAGAEQPVNPAFAQAVHEQTEGNPFFIEEILLHLVDVGALYLKEGHWQIRMSVLAENIPEGVREVIGRRLSRLSEATNQALTFASVLGREFEFDVLQSLSGLDEDTLLSALEEALGAALIQEQKTVAGVSYRFSHALVQETLYAELSLARKQRFHLRAGEAIEQAHIGRIEPYIGQLANHFYQGNDPDKAISYSRRAGDASVAVYAWEDALKHWETSLEVTEEHGAPDEELAELLERIGDLCYTSGVDFEKGYDFLERALAIYERMGARGKAAAIHSRLGRNMVSWAGRVDVKRALHHLEAAREVLETEAPDSQSLAYTYVGLALACSQSGDPENGLSHARRGREIGEKLNAQALIANAMAFEGMHLTSLGSFAEGFALMEQAYTMADERGSPLVAFTAAIFLSTSEANRLNPRASIKWAEEELGKPRTASAPLARFYLLGQLGLARAVLGQIEEARKIHEAGGAFQGVGNELEICSGEWEGVEQRLAVSLEHDQETGSYPGILSAALRLSDLHYWMGDYERSMAVCKVALETWGTTQLGQRQLTLRTRLALAAARAGCLEDAVEHVDVCRQRLNQGEDWCGVVAPANLATAVLSGLRGDYDAAWEAFGQALSTAREYGLVWVEAQVLHERARIHLARNRGSDRAEAFRLLDEAASIYRGMPAPRHVEMVLADKLAAQGIDRSEPHTSMDRVVGAVQSEHPDLKPHAAPDGTVTIMFSDIEGSTEKTDRLGDKAWMEVLREHNTIVREQITAFGGFEVKAEGDGFMVAFQSAGKAAECAAAIQTALAARNEGASEPVNIRVGLHSGEVIKEGEDFFGRNVIMAARVASHAKGGEIVASGVVRTLLAGTDIAWGEKRTVELKGLAGDHEIWPVAWE